MLDIIQHQYLKGNEKRLAELSPNILYRTQAMVYYRQNLEYLINGSIPPIKPSIKIAYNIPNFLNDINTNAVTNANEDCDYDYIKDIKDLMIKYDKGNGNNNIKENNEENHERSDSKRYHRRYRDSNNKSNEQKTETTVTFNRYRRKF